MECNLLHCICRLMGWPGRAQRLICWSAAGEALRKAQGACDAHISEDAGYHHDDRGGPRQNTFRLVWDSIGLTIDLSLADRARRLDEHASEVTARWRRDQRGYAAALFW
jgi:hypothetical protein